MKTVGKFAFFLFVLAGQALAQNRLQSGPPTAGLGSSFDVGAGYSYLTTSIPGAGRVNLGGVDVTSHADFSERWGATVDAGYVRTSDVLGTGSGGYVLTFLGGPVFYPFEHGKTRIFVHALVGAGLVDSAVPTTGNNYLHGWVARYAYAAGGGVERSVAGPFAVRFSGDYLRTAFVDSSDVVQLQNNLRVTASVVFRLRDRHSTR